MLVRQLSDKQSLVLIRAILPQPSLVRQRSDKKQSTTLCRMDSIPGSIGVLNSQFSSALRGLLHARTSQSCSCVYLRKIRNLWNLRTIWNLRLFWNLRRTRNLRNLRDTPQLALLCCPKIQKAALLYALRLFLLYFRFSDNLKCCPVVLESPANPECPEYPSLI